jgi:hypothetical protein
MKEGDKVVKILIIGDTGNFQTIITNPKSEITILAVGKTSLVDRYFNKTHGYDLNKARNEYSFQTKIVPIDNMNNMKVEVIATVIQLCGNFRSSIFFCKVWDDDSMSGSRDMKPTMFRRTHGTWYLCIFRQLQIQLSYRSNFSSDDCV